MTARSTIITAILVAAVFLALWLAASGRPSVRERIIRQESLLDFDPAEAERVEILRGGGRIVLERQKGVWFLSSPVHDLADYAAVRNLLKLASSLRSFETIEIGKKPGKVKAGEFGLSSPKVSLSITAAGRRHELWFGKETAIEGRIYVRVAGTDWIDVISSDLQAAVVAGAELFRNRYLFQMEPDSVASIRWRSDRGTIEIIREGTKWRILKPENARADGGRVRTLLHNITRAAVEEFLPEAGEEAAPVGDEGGMIELKDGQGRASTIARISESSGRLTGRLVERGATVVLPDLVGMMLNIIPRDLRERSLLRFDPDFVDRVRIERGSETLTLSRSGEGWKGVPGDFEADPEKAEVLLRMLGAAGLAEFVADTRAAVKDAGLDPPAATIRLLSHLSEDSLHATAGEHLIATVLIGNPAGGDRFLAATDSDPFVYSIPAELAACASPKPEDWSSRAVLYGEAEDVTWIEAGDGSWRIERDQNGEWRIRRGKGVLNQAASDSLAKALCRLRAVEWLEEHSPDVKDAPSMTLRFGWDNPSREKEEALTLDFWFGDSRIAARLTGVKRPFILSEPMTELLLQQPLSN